MDLLKFLFFTFKLAWQLLLAAGAFFLWLLSLLPDETSGDEEEWHSYLSDRGNGGHGPMPGEVRTYYRRDM